MNRETIELLCKISLKCAMIKDIVDEKISDIPKESIKSTLKSLIDDIQVEMGTFCDCSVYDLKFGNVDGIFKNINSSILRKFSKD